MGAAGPANSQEIFSIPFRRRPTQTDGVKAVAKTAKKKQAPDAEMIAAGLWDRDPYAGMTKAQADAFNQEAAKRSAEQRADQVAEFQKLLRFYKVEITDAAAWKLYVDQLAQLGRSILMIEFEGTNAGRVTSVPHAAAARAAVLDTAAANYSRLAKQAISKAKKSAALRLRILDVISAAKAEVQENAQRTNRRVLVKNENATIARMAGCEVSVVEKTRRHFGI